MSITWKVLEHDSDSTNVAVVEFDAGHRLNPLSREVLEGLHSDLDEVDKEDCGAVVIVSGQENFSVGVNTKEFSSLDQEGKREFVAREYELFSRLERTQALTSAVLDGYCLGNAAELALSCDFRLWGASAKIGYPEIRAGFAGPARRLSKYLTLGHIRPILFSGRTIAVEEGTRLALCDRELGEAHEASDYLEFLSPYLGVNPEGIGETKRRIAAAFDLGDARTE